MSNQIPGRTSKANRQQHDDLPLASKSVLVIEDEPLIALNVETALQDAGAACVRIVRSVADAQRAISAASPFDAAVVDLSVMDGDAGPLIEVLSAQGTPVVVTTGAIVEPDSAHFKQAVAILQKPYPEGELVKVVAWMVEQATERRPLPYTSNER